MDVPSGKVKEYEAGAREVDEVDEGVDAAGERERLGANIYEEVARGVSGTFWSSTTPYLDGYEMSDAVSVGDSTKVGECVALLLSMDPGSLTAVPVWPTQPLLSRVEVSMGYGAYGSYRAIRPCPSIDRGSEPLAAMGT